MPSLAPPADLFRALSAAMADLGAGWYVFGAQAVLFWGRPRLTADIDVTVQFNLGDTARLVDRLAAGGFTLRVEGTGEFIARTRVLPFVHEASQWPLDLVLGGPGLEEEFLRRARAVEFEPGLMVPVISPEDLIVTKVLAARSKDLDDVRGILAEQTSLDVNAVRSTLARLEAALGVSDLLPVFERELTRRNNA